MHVTVVHPVHQIQIDQIAETVTILELYQVDLDFTFYPCSYSLHPIPIHIYPTCFIFVPETWKYCGYIFKPNWLGNFSLPYSVHVFSAAGKSIPAKSSRQLHPAQHLKVTGIYTVVNFIGESVIFVQWFPRALDLQGPGNCTEAIRSESTE